MTEIEEKIKARKKRRRINWLLFTGETLIILTAFVFLIIAVFRCGEEQGAKKALTDVPIVIETVSDPEIDTTITHFPGKTDTSFTYIFYNVFVE